MSDAELREELRILDDDVARLRRTAAELRRQIGEEEPGDFADKSASIAAAEEQEALADQLEARRRSLAQRLGES